MSQLDNSNVNTAAQNEGTKSKKMVTVTAVIASVIIIICCVVSFTTPKQFNLLLGSTIELGSLEQNAENEGPEPIEWIVVAEENGKGLLLSKYCLANMPYDCGEGASQAWDSSSLREYLNGEFVAEAFSKEEQERLVSTELSNNSNAENAAKTSEDKVFLLSKAEIEEYILESGRGELLKTGTVSDTENSCWWWIRDPGYLDTFASIVKTNGAVYTRGESVINELGGVRPAMWVNAG